jgi:hypothetical protein
MSASGFIVWDQQASNKSNNAGAVGNAGRVDLDRCRAKRDAGISNAKNAGTKHSTIVPALQFGENPLNADPRK